MRHYRKVIKIKAADSPNVRLGLEEVAKGLKPSHREVCPGVVSFAKYLKRREMWDKVQQCIKLDAEFWEGAEALLFPPEWLDLAEARADSLARQRLKRRAKGLGVDPAEGGDSTVWAVVDELGLIELLSMKTPNTATIPNQTLALMRKYDLRPEQVCFDRGGGGKQHADRMEAQGYRVRSVGFGETIAIPPRYGAVLPPERLDAAEEKYAYKNRRAEMYGRLSMRLEPREETPVDQDGTDTHVFSPFALPREYTELRRQLALMPKWYDEEGRLYLPPKQRRTDQRKGRMDDADSTTVTLNQILGCSPDEADALVLAVHAMEGRTAPKVRVVS
jgi:hypothetical protein